MVKGGRRPLGGVDGCSPLPPREGGEWKPSTLVDFSRASSTHRIGWGPPRRVGHRLRGIAPSPHQPASGAHCFSDGRHRVLGTGAPRGRPPLYDGTAPVRRVLEEALPCLCRTAADRQPHQRPTEVCVVAGCALAQRRGQVVKGKPALCTRWPDWVRVRGQGGWLPLDEAGGRSTPTAGRWKALAADGIRWAGAVASTVSGGAHRVDGPRHVSALAFIRAGPARGLGLRSPGDGRHCQLGRRGPPRLARRTSGRRSPGWRPQPLC